MKKNLVALTQRDREVSPSGDPTLDEEYPTTAEEVTESIERSFKQSVSPTREEWRRKQREIWKKHHLGHIKLY